MHAAKRAPFFFAGQRAPEPARVKLARWVGWVERVDLPTHLTKPGRLLSARLPCIVSGDATRIARGEHYEASVVLGPSMRGSGPGHIHGANTGPAANPTTTGLSRSVRQ